MANEAKQTLAVEGRERLQGIVGGATVSDATFAQAWVARERFEDRHRGSAAPWLFGIARNVLLMSIRRGAVERLAQREALRLRIVDELTCDEVADALGTTPSAARVRVHRGLTSLRKRFFTKGDQR